MRLFVLTSLFLFTVGLTAQREAANWYFGNNAALDFNSGIPIALDDSRLNTVEGCANFSDAAGNLLFYTDGRTIWNRFHDIMENGEDLKGSLSATQSALVVPNPDQPNIYYIFTPDDVFAYGVEGSSEETFGFNYSVVDMTRDGGRGEVTIKNIDLLDQAAENVTAIQNFDTNEYWVVTHYRESFYSYKVNGNGVATSPVISRIGPAIRASRNYRGAVKISPDGTKLAIAHTIVDPEFEGLLYLYDFDVASGRVTNPLSLNEDRIYYGVEFSSNSSKLYASGLLLEKNGQEIITGLGEVVQFDLNSNIAGSLYVASTYESLLPSPISGTLQIGIDKKIYHSLPGDKLSVIRTPNLEGINCDFRQYSIGLGVAEASYGLPSFIQSFFNSIVTIENICENGDTLFTIDDTSSIQSVRWNFGDPSTGPNDVSNDIEPTHVFSNSGTYTVTLDVDYLNGSSREFIEFVEIADVPQANNGVELIQCDVDGIDDGVSLFNLNEANALFNNGNTDIQGFFFTSMTDAMNNENHVDPVGYENTSNGQVIYARAFENSECFSIVEITLTVKAVSDLGMYGSMQLCVIESGGFSVEVDTNEVYDQLETDFGAGTAQLYTSVDNALLEQEKVDGGPFIIQNGSDVVYYFRIENDNACDFIGSLVLELLDEPLFEDQVEVTLCSGQADLIAPEGFDQYAWSTGEVGKEIRVITVGDYQVTFTSGTCSYTQNFRVSEIPKIIIEEIIVNDFRVSNEIVVFVSEEGEHENLYSIDDGFSFQTSNIFQNLTPGVYNILVSNNCTEIIETVLVGGVDSFFTPNNDGINDIWTLENAEYFPNFSISIYDRYGTLMKMFQEADQGWNGTYLQQQMPSADYWYKINLEGEQVIKGHFALKR